MEGKENKIREVAILQGYRRKRDLFEGVAGNFLKDKLD
jgi:hypothetical protein